MPAMEVSEDDVQFSPQAIAAAWEAVDGLPVCVAVAVTNEFTEHTVTAADGVAEDRDVHFEEAGLLVEEKMVGVCAREIAEQYADYYIDLGRRNGRVLAISPGQVFLT